MAGPKATKLLVGHLPGTDVERAGQLDRSQVFVGAPALLAARCAHREPRRSQEAQLLTLGRRQAIRPRRRAASRAARLQCDGQLQRDPVARRDRGGVRLEARLADLDLMRRDRQSQRLRGRLLPLTVNIELRIRRLDGDVYGAVLGRQDKIPAKPFVGRDAHRLSQVLEARPAQAQLVRPPRGEHELERGHALKDSVERNGGPDRHAGHGQLTVGQLEHELRQSLRAIGDDRDLVAGGDVIGQ